MNKEGKPGRKPKIKDYNSIFAQRLRELVEKSHVKHEDIAKVVGVSRQAFSNWYNGETVPDIICASKIAKYFNVSLDYLVGNSNAKSVDVDLQAVCEYIGLSDDIVQSLKDEPIIKEAISEIILADKIILYSIDEYLHPRPVKIEQYEDIKSDNMSIINNYTSTELEDITKQLISIRDMEEITMRIYISDRLKSLRKQKEDILYGQHNPKKE